MMATMEMVVVEMAAMEGSIWMMAKMIGVKIEETGVGGADEARVWRRCRGWRVREKMVVAVKAVVLLGVGVMEKEEGKSK